jgi:hypothetical protein
MRKQKMLAEPKKKRGIGGGKETLTMAGVGGYGSSNNSIKTNSYEWTSKRQGLPPTFLTRKFKDYRHYLLWM